MYKIMIIVLFALASPAFAGGIATNTEPRESEVTLAQQAREKMKSFGESLKERLTTAMRESGPVDALQACNLDAPKITAAHSDDQRWKVGRTSLKLRNPANAPDAWEKEVLTAFEKRKQAGENINKLEHFEVVEQQGKSLFRYMKAIPTGELCLICHGGDEVTPKVIAKLKSLYPKDQARGFMAGDIRGAFTLSRELNNSSPNQKK